MNCFKHIDTVAVAQCSQCGKGLCAECSKINSHTICEDCSTNIKKKKKRGALKEILLTLLIGLPLGFVLGALAFDKMNPTGSIFDNSYFMLYLGLGLFSGWKTLNNITPQLFLVLPILGWLFYFIIKGCLALAVGIVAFPIRMIRNLFILFK